MIRCIISCNTQQVCHLVLKSINLRNKRIQWGSKVLIALKLADVSYLVAIRLRHANYENKRLHFLTNCRNQWIRVQNGAID